MMNEDKYEEYMRFSKNNYSSRINADNPLALEKALLEHLEEVQQALSDTWSVNDARTVREVYESDKIIDYGED